MKREWAEGWYRVTSKLGTTMGHYKPVNFHSLDKYMDAGNKVERVYVLTQEELAALIVDGIEAHFKYLETGEFEV